MEREVGRTGPGRPRRSGVSHQVLIATRELISERGYAGASVDQIATTAGVAKTTVYRRWPTKTELAVAALVDALGDLPEPRSLDDAVRWLADRVRDRQVHRLLTGLSAESVHDDGLRTELRRRLRDPYVAALGAQWQSSPEAATLAFDLVVGTLLQRATMTGSVDDESVADVAALAARVLR
ncbi:helix-turn-helix domain-containing protein [Nocardioides koreensis]